MVPDIGLIPELLAASPPFVSRREFNMCKIDWSKIKAVPSITQEEMDRLNSPNGKLCDYCGGEIITGDYEGCGACSDCYDRYSVK